MKRALRQIRKCNFNNVLLSLSVSMVVRLLKENTIWAYNGTDGDLRNSGGFFSKKMCILINCQACLSVMKLKRIHTQRNTLINSVNQCNYGHWLSCTKWFLTSLISLFLSLSSGCFPIYKHVFNMNTLVLCLYSSVQFPIHIWWLSLLKR